MMGYQLGIGNLSDFRLLVGLGNPGKSYEYTRHNLGFLVVGNVARQRHLKIHASPVCDGLEAKGSVFGRDFYLLLPQTMMNNSGTAVKRFVEKHKIDLSNILVVCDDFHLAFGQLRIRPSGSDGGHNGLSSIVDHLGSKDFSRLRMGIGNPKKGQDPADFVLEEFRASEKKQLRSFVQEAADCCEAWLIQDIEKVMGQFNKRKGNE